MQFPIRILTESEITSNFPIEDIVASCEHAYRSVASGDAQLSPKYHYSFDCGPSGAFASYFKSDDALALKIATTRLDNLARGLPRGISQVIVLDATTGAPKAFLDGKAVTLMRTGAGAAVGAKALARPDSRVAALFGPGAAGRTSLLALAPYFQLETVHVVGRNPGAAADFISRVQPEVPFKLIESDPETATRSADIIVTATAAMSPLIKHEWIKPGTHISAIGSDYEGKQELEAKTILDGYFVTDDFTQCMEIGEANVPISQGVFTKADIDAHIGDVLLGRSRGRSSPEEITVFDSSGIGAQDGAMAHMVLRGANERNIGRVIEL